MQAGVYVDAVRLKELCLLVKNRYIILASWPLKSYL